MPELPEVEGFKNIFERALNKKISDVTCKTPSLLKKITAKKFSTLLIGKSFSSVTRKGKFLITKLTGTEYMVIFHFGMTGWLEYKKSADFSDEDKKYGQIIFFLPSGYALLFLDKRKFAKVYVVHAMDEIKMGPDALSISEKNFLSLLETKKNSSVKTLLLDQSSIAGIGNEYSNEILFQAKIDPNRKAGSLSKAEQEALYIKMRAVLKKAVQAGGVTRLPKSWLLYHLKIVRDMKCPKNKAHTLKRKTIGGRSAIYCPIDQK